MNGRAAAREPVNEDGNGRVASRHQQGRVDFGGQSKGGYFDATAAGALHNAGGGRECQMGTGLRDGDDFSVHAGERYASGNHRLKPVPLRDSLPRR